MLAIGSVNRMLKVEKTGSEGLGHVQGKIQLQDGHVVDPVHIEQRHSQCFFEDRE